MSDSSAARLSAALAGRYRIDGELGAGGMAKVYLAEDLKHQRKVAIKVLRPELAEAVGTERFLQEIAVTAKLQHPHILPLFDSGEADGLPFYAMPYVVGESLHARLEREGPLPVSEALAIARDVAAALTFAHAQGVVHRDIKPENILLEDGEALVADFGIALALANTDGQRLTGTGLSIGTPAYMSPEQLWGEKTIDARSDVYALGCLLYEMLVGRPPFDAASVSAIAALSREAPRASALRSDVPAAIDAAIAKALSRLPGDRFSTPREFIAACVPQQLSSAAAEASARRGRRVALLSAGVAALLVLTVAGFAWRQRQVTSAHALLPQITALAEQQRFAEAFALAAEAERWIPEDSTLAALLVDVSDLLTVRSLPEGAEVLLERIPSGSEGKAAPQAIGRTPLLAHRIPRVDHRVLIRREGFVPAERLASSKLARAAPFAGVGREVLLDVTLHERGAVPEDMVVVPGGRYTMASPDLPLGLQQELANFLIDRYEVSNASYREFLRSGNPPPGFVDRSGLPGPRDWINQTPPEGQEQHPVVGVSWQEAAAYCAAQGRRLPSMFEWEKAARDGQTTPIAYVMPWGLASAAAEDRFRANFASTGSSPVDAYPFGISPYGAYGMAGNAKEWLANRVGDARAVAGGSWRDPAYVFGRLNAVSDDTRATDIGFRCARTLDPAEPSDQGAAVNVRAAEPPTYRPVDAATYRTLLSHYRYDPRPANPRGITTEETADWTRERLWLDGAGRDSILAYLYLPKRAQAPYQTLVYVPSSAALFFEPVWLSIEQDLAPHIKAGRAVFAVVLDGMLERPKPAGYEPPTPSSVAFRDEMVKHATEIRLGMDWLVSRDDIDSTRLAYIGVSLGAGSRLAFAAVDPRFKGVVLIGAGIDERIQPTLPEAANFNFAPYIRPPKLFVNGRNDEEHPWLTRALPLWNLLREPKELALIDGAGHLPPIEERVPVINRFLDRTLGSPVLR